MLWIEKIQYKRKLLKILSFIKFINL